MQKKRHNFHYSIKNYFIAFYRLPEADHIYSVQDIRDTHLNRITTWSSNMKSNQELFENNESGL